MGLLRVVPKTEIMNAPREGVRGDVLLLKLAFDDGVYAGPYAQFLKKPTIGTTETVHGVFVGVPYVEYDGKLRSREEIRDRMATRPDKYGQPTRIGFDSMQEAIEADRLIEQMHKNLEDFFVGLYI